MEVGPRDGLQIEAKVFSTDQKVELVERLVAAGLRQIEVGSFVNPKGVPQMADSPEVFKRLKQYEGVEYHGLWLNAKGLDRALDGGHVKVTGKLIVHATDTFSKRNTNKTIDETLHELPAWIAQYRQAGIEVNDLHIPAAFGCNFEGDVRPADVVALISRVELLMNDSGNQLKHLRLADTMGWANPIQVKRLVGLVRERWPNLKIR